ncbi:MAG: beta-methylgalactoside transporter, partial [Lachnospiraceae bacterium]|nr:beta-methylgalactoside transporter [Lachnospiraceae bacterium]
MKTVENLKRRYADFQALDAKDKRNYWKEFALNNALYVLIIIAIIYTAVQNPNFTTPASIVNIISLSAANIPIAVG